MNALPALVLTCLGVFGLYLRGRHPRPDEWELPDRKIALPYGTEVTEWHTGRYQGTSRCDHALMVKLEGLVDQFPPPPACWFGWRDPEAVRRRKEQARQTLRLERRREA